MTPLFLRKINFPVIKGSAGSSSNKIHHCKGIFRLLYQSKKKVYLKSLLTMAIKWTSNAMAKSIMQTSSTFYSYILYFMNFLAYQK